MRANERVMGRLGLLLLLFGIALLPRLVFLFETTRSPLFNHLYLDAKSYDTWAMEIASGQWARPEPFHMAPLYPYFLGLLYKVFGHNILLLHVIQHLIGASSLVLVYLVALRLFGSGPAIAAYALALGYGPFLYFEGQVLSSSLAVALGLLGLHLLLRSIARGGEGLFAAGLALGAGSVARPDLMAFFPLALLWVLVRERIAARRALLYAAGFVVALLPSTAHNLRASGEFIPVSSHGGVSFYLGNNPYTRGTYVPPPQFGGTPEAIDIVDSKRLAEAAEGRALSASEVSGYWYRRSFEFLRQNPGRAVGLLARKTALYFNDYEIPLDVNYEFDRRLYGILRFAPFSFGLLLSLAVVGAALIPRGGGRGRILVLYVLANAASVIAFFVCARYRQTAVPAVAILAAFAVTRLARDARARRWRPFAAVAAAVALVAIPVHLPVYLGRDTSAVRSTVILGRAHAAAGDPARAEMLFRDALRLDPRNVDANMNLGLLCYDSRRFREAADAFAVAAEEAPEFAGAWNNLGNALRESGDPVRAIEAIRAAVRADTSYAGARNNLGYTLALAGREDEAEKAYRSALRIDPASVDAWANLSDLQFRMGKFAESVETMAAAARFHPTERAVLWKRSRIERAAALSASARQAADRGDRAGGARLLREALAVEGAPVRTWAERDDAVRSLLPEVDPAEPGGNGGTRP